MILRGEFGAGRERFGGEEVGRSAARLRRANGGEALNEIGTQTISKACCIDYYNEGLARCSILLSRSVLWHCLPGRPDLLIIYLTAYRT